MRIFKRVLMYGIPKSLLFKIIIALIIILLGHNVFALEVDVSSSITSPSSSTQGKYQGTEIYNTGTNNNYNINTRYQGRLSRIRFNLPLPSSLGECFTTNVDYKVTLNMATNDWRNKFGSVTASAYGTNFAHYSTVFVSQKKIYFTFKVPSSNTTCIDYVLVDLKSTDISNTAFTGETNWNLSSIKLNDPTISTGAGSSGGTTTPTPNPDYSNITNNQDKNTNNIINNQNDNTNSIIENNNSNFDSIRNVIDEASSVIGNSVDNISNQLGNCFTNLLSFNDIRARGNSYLSDYNGYQIEADTNNSPDLKLQFYNKSSLLGHSSYRPLLSVGRFNFSFTYNRNITTLVFGVNGSTIDTLFELSLETLDLIENEVYTLSYSISDSTQGSITFTNFSLIKGDYVSNVFIDYGHSICTSKLDDFVSVSEQNTDDIINNQNQNTKDIIDSQNVCRFYDVSSIVIDNSSMRSSGNVYSQVGFGITDYISIINSSINVVNTYSSSSSTDANLCFYNANKLVISCISNNNLISGSSLDIPLNSSYVRFVIRKSDNRPQFKVCSNGNQALSDNISNINDSINNSNVDSGTGSDFFNDFATDDNGGISAIITKPLVIVNNLLSNNNQCTNLNLPEFMGVSTAYLPSGCILWNNAPSAVITLWNIFVCGFGAYYILKDLFKIIERLKNPDDDRVEVLDL